MVINTKKIINNINTIHKKTNKAIMAVLKSNAYNLGARKIVKILKQTKIDFFVFNHFREYLECIDLLMDKQVLILESINKRCYDSVSYNVRLSINSLDDARKIASTNNKYMVHIQIDTGMNRDGIKNINDFKEVLKLLNYNVHIEGIYTHFTDAGNPTKTFFQQLKFLAFLAIYKPLIIHTSSTSALNYSILGSHCRVGIGLYGFDEGLEKAVNLYTKLYRTTILLENEKLGYNGLFKANHTTQIGIIPIGYYEGFRNKYIYFKDKSLRVVGKICMNHSFVLLNKRIKNSSLLNIFPISDKINKEKQSYYEQLTSFRNFSRIYITEYKHDLSTIFKKTIRVRSINRERTRGC